MKEKPVRSPMVPPMSASLSNSLAARSWSEVRRPPWHDMTSHHYDMTWHDMTWSYSYPLDPVKGWGGEWYLDILQFVSKLEVHYTSTYVPARVGDAWKDRLFVMIVIFQNLFHSKGLIVERIVQSIIVNNGALAVLQAVPCLYLQLLHTIQLLGRADLGLNYHMRWWGLMLSLTYRFRYIVSSYRDIDIIFHI